MHQGPKQNLGDDRKSLEQFGVTESLILRGPESGDGTAHAPTMIRGSAWRLVWLWYTRNKLVLKLAFRQIAGEAVSQFWLY